MSDDDSGKPWIDRQPSYSAGKWVHSMFTKAFKDKAASKHNQITGPQNERRLAKEMRLSRLYGTNPSNKLVRVQAAKPYSGPPFMSPPRDAAKKAGSPTPKKPAAPPSPPRPPISPVRESKPVLVDPYHDPMTGPPREWPKESTYASGVRLVGDTCEPYRSREAAVVPTTFERLHGDDIPLEASTVPSKINKLPKSSLSKASSTTAIDFMMKRGVRVRDAGSSMVLASRRRSGGGGFKGPGGLSWTASGGMDEVSSLLTLDTLSYTTEEPTAMASILKAAVATASGTDGGSVAGASSIGFDSASLVSASFGTTADADRGYTPAATRARRDAKMKARKREREGRAKAARRAGREALANSGGSDMGAGGGGSASMGTMAGATSTKSRTRKRKGKKRHESPKRIGPQVKGVKFGRSLTVMSTLEPSKLSEEVEEIREEQRRKMREALKWQEVAVLYAVLMSEGNRKLDLENFDDLMAQMRRAASESDVPYHLSRTQFWRVLSKWDVRYLNSNRIFSAFDSNKTDSIDFREVMLALRLFYRRNLENTQDKLLALFRIYTDEDRSLLTRNDVLTIMGLCALDDTDREIMRRNTLSAIHNALGEKSGWAADVDEERFLRFLKMSGHIVREFETHVATAVPRPPDD